MKHLFLLVLLSGWACTLTAQKSMNTYSTEWKTVDSLWQKKGLPESALKEVRKIYDAATREGNSVQQVKALLYMGQLTEVNTEDADAQQIVFLENKLAGAKEPAISLLHSMIATAYWQYYQEHRWELRDRTPTAGKSDDILSWSSEDLQAAIEKHFKASLENRKFLQVERLDAYGPIIIKGKPEQASLRPTLYDLLAHAALDYFTREEDFAMPRPLGPASDISVVAGKSIDLGQGEPSGNAGQGQPGGGIDFSRDNVLFAPAAAFVAHRFSVEDSSDLAFQALLLYQDLTRFHLRDVTPDALVDLEIARLQFAKAKTVLEDGSFLYMKSLSFLEKAYPANPAVAQAAYLRIQEQYQEATDQIGSNAPADAAHLPALADECRRIIRAYPRSEGANNCARLLQSLEKKSFSLQVERVNIPGKPFRMRIAYKNIGTIHYRIISISEPILAILRRDENYWNQFIAAKALRSASQSLPVFQDLREHSVELKVDKLEPGRYAILASADPSFSTDGNPLAVAFFHVSNIAFLHQDKDFFVLDRETGKPIAGADVRVMRQTYDYTLRKYLNIHAAQVRSGSDGYFRMPYLDPKQVGQVRLDIWYGNDRLYLDEAAYYYYDNSEEDAGDRDRARYESKNRRIFLFTDRSIYRPGQTVYFKGILMTRDFDTKRYKIVPDAETTVFLYNTESEETDSLRVRTNAFGSYAGEFRIPQTVMTGQWSLEDEEHEGQVSFSVEEYKRPSFYVETKPVGGSHRIGDSIRVQGTAMAYAGAARTDAQVRYRVTRQARFPFPWLSRFYPYAYRPPAEIAHGVTRTDAEGKFHIPFVAIPDPRVNAKYLPVFYYEVSADVTDAGGETRSMTMSVPVGYHALNLGTSIPDNAVVATNADVHISLSARNLSGEPLTQQVALTVIPVSPPGRLIRPRLWAAPDTVLLSESEFLQAFPNDPYREEDKRENWSRGNPIARLQDTIRRGSGSIIVPMKGRAPGWYLAETVATDPFGQEVRNETWFYHAPDAKASAALPHYLESRVVPAAPPNAAAAPGKSKSRSRKKTPSTGTGNPLPQLNASYAPGTQNADLPVTYKPGDRATIRITTSLPELWVIRALQRAGEAPKLPQEGKISDPKKAVAMEDPGHPYLVTKLTAGATDQSLDIRENDLGGLGVSHTAVMHNRLFTADQSLSVPWAMKELDVTLTTFRAKTEPGAGETWTVQLRGKQGERWAAEILASMYDASLDQFQFHQWQRPDIYPVYPQNIERYPGNGWDAGSNFQSARSEDRSYPDSAIKWIEKKYDVLLWDQQQGRIMPLNTVRTHVLYEMAAAPIADSAARFEDQNKLAGKVSGVAVKPVESDLNEVVVTAASVSLQQTTAPSPSQRIRTDFRETAFFFPQLYTDSAGNVQFKFTMPDALTTWKWQVLAHTKDLALGYAVQQIVTQKELMVQPNAPRFLREGDQLVFPARITNMGEQEVTGQAELQVLDAETGQVVDGLFNNLFPVQYFTAAPGQGTLVQFPLQVPGNFSKPVTYRIIAKTKQHSDGEEQSLPVLSNRILLTESLPFFQKGPGTKTYSFDKLKQSAQSPTLTHHALTVELSTNPAWYAVQAIPYLTGYPFDCSEQVFNRFYGNALAAHIANSRPAMKTFYAAWMKEDAAGKKSLRSKLAQNPELKSIILQETPWVLDAKQQDEQLKQIAILFDEERLSKDMDAAIAQLEKAQSPNGGFVWFPGGPDDRYITQYIVAGIGKLRKTGTVPERYRERLDIIARKGLVYMHARIREDYDDLKKKKADLQKQQIGYTQIQYLYALSFFQGEKTEAVNLQAITYYHKQAQQFWTSQSRQLQAMIALALWRSKDGKTPAAILASLKERAIKNEALGMYWKRGASPWYWQEADLESQALLVEAFTEITKDESSIAAMKQWLLTQKQSSHWESTRATADACYALLLRGSDWLSSNMQASVTLGGAKTFDWKNDKSMESGTGYRKSVIPGSEVDPGMGDIRVTLSDPSGRSAGVPAWGAAYWQYFEQLEHVATAGGPLSVRKKLYRSINTGKGPVLEPLEGGEALRVGDKLVVRLEIRADRDMEYVHLKDMRASGTEPLNVLSGYRWQGSLGYYESTRDAATNFFFPRIPRGTYVFEYPLIVAQEGSFGTGPATIQCMYAPEFTGHSEGYRIKVN